MARRSRLDWRSRQPYLERLTHSRAGLTREWAWEQWNRQGGLCYWTGMEMDWSGRDDLTKASIDRIDVDGEYTPGNVVFACLGINVMRRRASVDRFMAFLPALRDALNREAM